MTAPIPKKQRSRRAVIVSRLTAVLMIALWFVFAFWVSAPARKVARVAQVRAEISVLESAIAKFKAMYGIDPPSGVTLYATKEGWDSDRRSRNAIRQLSPEFDFETCGEMGNVPADGFHLNGAECLVFFLGGVIDPVTGAPTGFSKNNATPFVAKRGDHPLFEFNQRRLVDLDQDGFREFLDPLPVQTKPYLYISSSDGQGYDPADFDGAMRDIYRIGSSPDAKPWKPKGYQIISPGTDCEYGIGGVYNPESPDLKKDSNRTAEFDNVTNFAEDFGRTTTNSIRYHNWSCSHVGAAAGYRIDRMVLLVQSLPTTLMSRCVVLVAALRVWHLVEANHRAYKSPRWLAV